MKSDRSWDRIIAEEMREAKIRQIKASMKRNGLDVLMKTCRFDTFRAEEDWQKDMYRKAVKYAASDPPVGWMLASGQSGCGKTHICTAVTGVILGRMIPVRYMLWRQDSVKIKPSSFTDPEQLNRDMANFKKAQVLYIDDFLKGGASQADLKAAFELLDYRYRVNLPTIISTELSPEELIRTDEAIAGRILEKAKDCTIWIRPDQKRNRRI